MVFGNRGCSGYNLDNYIVNGGRCIQLNNLLHWKMYRQMPVAIFLYKSQLTMRIKIVHVFVEMFMRKHLQ